MFYRCKSHFLKNGFIIQEVLVALVVSVTVSYCLASLVTHVTVRCHCVLRRFEMLEIVRSFIEKNSEKMHDGLLQEQGDNYRITCVSHELIHHKNNGVRFYRVTIADATNIVVPLSLIATVLLKKEPREA